ncbi:hypothetical protein BH10CYA1_BH10CYA1_06020 [soil metagenome]
MELASLVLGHMSISPGTLTGVFCMSNRRITLPVIFVLLTAIPAQCKDMMASKAFAEADKYAQQRQHFTDNKEVTRQSDIDIVNIKSTVAKLNKPNQLVDFAAMCDQKIKTIPSDSKYEPYFDYFEQVTMFSVRKLGRMTSPAAVKALTVEIPKVVHVDGSMGLAFDEAKVEQAKLLQAKIAN